MNGITLGDFLRTRRAALVPEHENATSLGRRRVPGLRREEVARLVGVSVDYYTRLEQGRRIAPSEGVLNALAEVLQLDQLAQEHMRDLAWNNSRAMRQHESVMQQASLGMLRLMESFGDLPAVLVGRRTDVLAINPTARHLIDDFNAMPAHARNAVRWLFTSERAREIHPDWEAAASGLVGMLRMDAGRYPNDPRTAELVEELSATSKHFAQLWNGRHLATSVARESKVIEHAHFGRIRFYVEAVTTPTDRNQVLQVLIPADPAAQSSVRQLQDIAASR
jgi:transcriptional regulator with XRE-family HTH domain